MNGTHDSGSEESRNARLLITLNPARVDVLTAPDAVEAERLRELAERVRRFLLRELRGLRVAA